MASSALHSTPSPTFFRTERPEPNYAPGERESGEQFWVPFLKLFCWIYDYIFGIRPDLSAAEIKKFNEREHTALRAWCPPSWYTDQAKLKYYPEIVRHYKVLLANWEGATVKSPYALCYSRFSVALEKDKENPKCLKALTKKVTNWIGTQITIHIGIPYDEMKEERPTLSHDFILACGQIRNLSPTTVTTLYIHGPVEEQDHQAIKALIITNRALKELHINVLKKSAQYFLSEIPIILKKLNSLKALSLRNLSKDPTFAVPDSVWKKLSQQQRCTITFFNIPPMPIHFSSDKLIFNVESSI